MFPSSENKPYLIHHLENCKKESILPKPWRIPMEKWGIFYLHGWFLWVFMGIAFFATDPKASRSEKSSYIFKEIHGRSRPLMLQKSCVKTLQIRVLHGVLSQLVQTGPMNSEQSSMILYIKLQCWIPDPSWFWIYCGRSGHVWSTITVPKRLICTYMELTWSLVSLMLSMVGVPTSFFSK